MMRDVPSPLTRRRALGLLLAGLLPAGCGYSLRAPYTSKIQTVYVPVFKSQSFRRDLNFTLTRMVQDEIRRRTPFRVVSTPEEADSTLEGTITFVDKNVMVESPNNLPRQIMGGMAPALAMTNWRVWGSQRRTESVT